MNDVAHGAGAAPGLQCNLDGLVQKLLALRAEIDAALAELANHAAASPAARAEAAATNAAAEFEQQAEAQLATPQAGTPENAEDAPASSVIVLTLSSEGSLPDAGRQSAGAEDAPVSLVADPTPSSLRSMLAAAAPATNSEPESIPQNGCATELSAPSVAEAAPPVVELPAIEKGKDDAPAPITVIGPQTKAANDAKAPPDRKRRPANRRYRFHAVMIPTCLAASLAGAIFVLSDAGDLGGLRERAGPAGALFDLLDTANWPFDLPGQAARLRQSLDTGEPAPILHAYGRFEPLSDPGQPKVSAPVSVSPELAP